MNTKALSIGTVAAACCLTIAAGCATLAHKSAHGMPTGEMSKVCNGEGDVCPWLIGDGLLLIPGIVPGVVAFAVDFSTGAWQHHSHDQSVPSSPDVTASAQDGTPALLFPRHVNPASYNGQSHR